jgi:hypothetical protein
VPPQSFYVHHFKLDRLSCNFPGLEVLGPGDPIRDDVNPDLLKAVVDLIDGQCQGVNIAGRIKFGGSLARRTERQKTETLLNSSTGL